MALVRSEHSCYLREVLLTTLDQARQQAVANFQNSQRFEARLHAEYKEGMRDMKVSFTLANPSLTELYWSFMSEISRETKGNGEKGEVVGGAQMVDDVVVIEEQKIDDDLPVTEWAGPPEQ